MRAQRRPIERGGIGRARGDSGAAATSLIDRVENKVIRDLPTHTPSSHLAAAPPHADKRYARAEHKQMIVIIIAAHKSHFFFSLYWNR